MRSQLLPALLALISASTLAAQTIQINKDNRTIAVTANDVVTATADLAIVHIGFQAYGTNEQTAYAEGSQRSNAILKALNAAGIKDDLIEGDDQALTPLEEYELKNLPAQLRGKTFRITQSWSVKCSPEDAARTLDIAVKAGANQSGNISWQMRDPDALEAKAAARALAHAQQIAARMAEGLHIKIGPLVYASNQQSEPGGTMPMAGLSARLARPAPAPLAIRSRKVQQSATVYAVFAVE